MQRVNLLLLGFGHVGRALVALLDQQRAGLQAEGLDLRITGAAARHGSVYDGHGLDLHRLKELATSGKPLTDYPFLTSQIRGATTRQLVAEADADIVVELTPTNLEDAEPGLSHLTEALERGRSVVSANKGPLALYPSRLAKLAQRHQAEIGIEGSVLGGTPLLHLARGALRGQQVQRLTGILNGTCNYILSQMEAGLSFADALADAKAKGYAEADPRADIDGLDTLAKTAILAWQFFGTELSVNSVPCLGIRGLTQADIAAAKQEGKRWKLVAELRRENGALIAQIGPKALSLDHPLASVGGVQNAVCFETDCLDHFTVTGPGAGPKATASAVLADILRIAENLREKRNVALRLSA